MMRVDSVTAAPAVVEAGLGPSVAQARQGAGPQRGSYYTLPGGRGPSRPLRRPLRRLLAAAPFRHTTCWAVGRLSISRLRRWQMEMTARGATRILLLAVGGSEAVRYSGWRASLRLTARSAAAPERVAALVREVERETTLVPGVR